MDTILTKLRKDHDSVSFEESDTFYWSPTNRTVYFTQQDKDSEENVWTLIHEVAHAELDHFDFKSDFHLIMLEADAWGKTLELCKSYGVKAPDDSYIQDCMDTYRNWQYRRSLCPECDSGGVQIGRGAYFCISCENKWDVTKQRFCRVYRKSKTAQ